MAKTSINFERSRRIKRRIISSFCVLALLIGGATLSTTLISVDQKTIVSYTLPRSFHNLKIVYATDFLYNGSNDYFMNEVVHRINSSRADIVVLGGNYGNRFENSLKFFDVIPNIHARLAVVAVLGENDIQKEERDDYLINQKMKQKNISLLVNQTLTLKQDGEALHIYGIDDYINGKPDYAPALSTLRQDEFVVFACHSHKALNDITNTQDEGQTSKFSDLSLIGSTLGGQYIFNEPIQRIINPIYAPKYYRGWHSDKHSSILVSNGVGVYSGFRLLIRPLIHEITIKYR